MKRYLILTFVFMPTVISLLFVFLPSCHSPEQNRKNLSDSTFSKGADSLDFKEFSKNFKTITLVKGDTMNIHHWQWGKAGNSAFQGAIISAKLLNMFVDSSVFHTNTDEDYYAIAHLMPINAFLIRSRMSEAEHLQYLYLLMYDAELKQFTNWTKVAGYFGQEGFINQMASWLVLKEKTTELVMRNNNWSISPKGIEQETDSLRTYELEKDRFVEQETIKITDKLVAEFSFPL